MLGVAIAGLLMGTAAQPGPAQAGGSQSESQSPTIRIQSILVTTPVTVIDHSGEFVSDLDEAAFRIYDNGVHQQIQRFEIAEEPLALVILVETGDSVKPLLYQVRALAPLFSDLLAGPDGRIAVIGFGDQVSVLQDFSSNPGQLKSTLGQIVASGRKARLNDALIQAMHMLESCPTTERRLIVVLSEGADRGSQNDRAAVVYLATSDEVTIYGMHFSHAEAEMRKPPEDHPPGPLDGIATLPTPPGTVPTATNSGSAPGGSMDPFPLLEAGGELIGSKVVKTALQYYAEFTGGTYYSHWSNVKLQDQLERVASEVHSQYEIAYKPTTLSRNGFHRIDVEVEKPGLRVRARNGYFYQPR
jgi:VWFA-related protein